MKTLRLRIPAIVCSAWLAGAVGGAPASSRQTPPSTRSAQSVSAAAPRESGQIFTEPVLVKGSPTNHISFDVSWNDNSTQRYYLADRTNNAIDLVDSATD